MMSLGHYFFFSVLLVGFPLGGHPGSLFSPNGEELLQVNVGLTLLSSEGEASPSR